MRVQNKANPGKELFYPLQANSKRYIVNYLKINFFHLKVNFYLSSYVSTVQRNKITNIASAWGDQENSSR